jgi:hypothetical protein
MYTVISLSSLLRSIGPAASPATDRSAEESLPDRGREGKYRLLIDR